MCKKVYLDTAHWIDLAEGNGPIVGFEEAVSDEGTHPRWRTVTSALRTQGHAKL